MKSKLSFSIFAFIIGVTAVNTAQAQTYDPYAVQAINNLIANNGLKATPNAPETWWFAFWNDETPKQIIELYLGLKLAGNAVLVGLTTLQFLDCSDNNNLTELDVSNCTQLQKLYCYNNKLTKLTLTNCTALQDIQATNNCLAKLDVSNCTDLQILVCNNNNLTELDVTKCMQLRGLACQDNHLSKLNVTVYIQGITCYNNQLAELDVTSCTQLNLLRCFENRLTKLDLSGLDNLNEFYGNKQSTSLTLHKNEAEEYTCPISLNNPTFGSDAISYSEEILKSSDNTVSSTSFAVQTGKPGFELSGTMNFNYSIEGIEAPEGVELKVYPNPTTGELHIGYPTSDYPISDIQIYDIVGKIQKIGNRTIGQSEITMDISYLPSGIYFIQIQSEKGTATVEIIKK